MRYLKLLAVAAFALLSSSSASASISLVGGPALSESALGSYTLDFTYTPSSASAATLTFDISNTSPASNGGFLTALAFGNPFDLIAGLTVGSTTPNASAFGFLSNQNVQPYGSHDFAIAATSSWQGGGNPSGGIGDGESATIVLNATGSMLDTITEQDFLNALSTGGGEGAYAFIARFRGFDDGGSDKVPGVRVQEVIPEASTAVIWSVVFGLGFIGWKRRRIA